MSDAVAGAVAGAVGDPGEDFVGWGVSRNLCSETSGGWECQTRCQTRWRARWGVPARILQSGGSLETFAQRLQEGGNVRRGGGRGRGRGGGSRRGCCRMGGP